MVNIEILRIRKGGSKEFLVWEKADCLPSTRFSSPLYKGDCPDRVAHSLLLKIGIKIPIERIQLLWGFQEQRDWFYRIELNDGEIKQFMPDINYQGAMIYWGSLLDE